MPKTGRKRSIHEFAGQQDGTNLAEWLNGEQAPRIGAERAEIRAEGRMRKRIAQLVEDLNTNAEEYLKRGKANSDLTERIDRELARHTLRVQTLHVQDTGRYKTLAETKWTFSWHSSAGSRSAEMIFRIVRLGERGFLPRIRRCSRDRCRRWFYAKFNHQRFCGSRCQVLHYQTSEEWKQRRRERYRER
jgi:hypothetical protein